MANTRFTVEQARAVLAAMQAMHQCNPHGFDFTLYDNSEANPWAAVDLQPSNTQPLGVKVFYPVEYGCRFSYHTYDSIAAFATNYALDPA